MCRQDDDSRGVVCSLIVECPVCLVEGRQCTYILDCGHTVCVVCAPRLGIQLDLMPEFDFLLGIDLATSFLEAAGALVGQAFVHRAGADRAARFVSALGADNAGKFVKISGAADVAALIQNLQNHQIRDRVVRADFDRHQDRLTCALPPVRPGTVVRVATDGWESTDYGVNTFWVNFKTGAGDTALHWAARGRKKVVVRNSKVSDRWETEERWGGYPYGQNSPWVTEFIKTHRSWSIRVNDQQFDFEDRVAGPIECMCTSMNLKGLLAFIVSP